MNKINETMGIIRHVAAHTDSVVLFYSGGKDSIVILDMIVPFFKKIFCVHKYTVPQMGWFEPYREWCRHYGNTEYIEVPDLVWYGMKKYGIYCPPNNDIKMPKNHAEVEETIKAKLGCKYAFNGMKGVDGFMKRMRLKLWERNYYISTKFNAYPLAKWTNPEVRKYLQVKNLIKPFHFSNAKDAELSQGFGLTADVLMIMRNKYPSDYKKILQEFPYAELVFYQDISLYEKQLRELMN